MSRFMEYVVKHTRAVKYSGGGTGRTDNRLYTAHPRSKSKLTDHDVQLQEYRVVDIYSQKTSVF